MEVYHIDSYEKLMEIENNQRELTTFVSGECSMYVFKYGVMLATVYVGKTLAAGEIVEQGVGNVTERAKMLQAVARWLRDSKHKTKLIWPSKACPIKFYHKDNKFCGHGSHILFKTRGPKHKRWSVIKQMWINGQGKQVEPPRRPGKNAFVRDCWQKNKRPSVLSLMDVNWLVAPLNTIVFENMDIVEIQNETPVLKIFFTEEVARTTDGEWEETGIDLSMLFMP